MCGGSSYNGIYLNKKRFTKSLPSCKYVNPLQRSCLKTPPSKLTSVSYQIENNIYDIRRKKSSLFPLTSPKKLGTVGRHNFFFLINCKHVHFCYFYLYLLKKLNTIILMNCQQNCKKMEEKSQN